MNQPYSGYATIEMNQDRFRENEINKVDVRTTDSGQDDTATEAFRASNEIALGTVIVGHYEILSIIGIGATGTVYKAKHLLVGSVRAIKILHVKNDDRVLRRFQQEAKASLCLNHPNIVRVYEFGIEPNLQQPYLVMEYVEGEALSAVLAKQHQLAQERACGLIEQVCQGLAHSHGNGIVHRDVKPANIILTRTGSGAEQAKLVDFGIAKITAPEEGQNLTQTGEVFGTPLYMSPEQCLGRKVDARSDIYSLGCVLYECLAGKPPFQGQSAIETIMMHVNPPELALATTDASKDLKSIIQKSLEPDPDERYQSAINLAQDLLRLKKGESIRLSKSKRRRLFSHRQGKESQVALVGIAVFILFAAIACGSFLLQLNNQIVADSSPSDKAWTLHTLAQRQIKDGMLTQAKQNEELALVWLAQARPDNAQKMRTNQCLRALAMLEESRGDATTAERRLQKALQLAQEAPGPKNSLLVETRSELAQLYRKHDKAAEAEKLEMEKSVE